MRKTLTSLFFSTLFITALAQERKWYPMLEVDFVFPFHKSYEYKLRTVSKISPSTTQLITIKNKLKSSTFAAIPSGVQLSYNYLFSDRFSLGILAGIQIFKLPNLEMVKLGGLAKYHFGGLDRMYVYGQAGINMPFTLNQFKIGTNVRLGLGYPVFKKDKYNLNINVFYDRHYFNLEKTQPIIVFDIPKSFTFQSISLGVGIHFLSLFGKKKLTKKQIRQKHPFLPPD